MEEKKKLLLWSYETLECGGAGGGRAVWRPEASLGRGGESLGRGWGGEKKLAYRRARWRQPPTQANVVLQPKMPYESVKKGRGWVFLSEI